MKKQQFRIINKGKGVLSLQENDLNKVYQPTKTSELVNDGANGADIYLTENDISEYTLSPVSGNVVSLLKDNTVVSTLDLSLYLDDTNLARIVNGTLDANTGIATFTRDDATTFTIDMSSLSDIDTYITGGTYNNGTLELNNNLNNNISVSGFTEPSGLEAINDGNGVGWRLIGKTPENYGDVGNRGVDFSNSTTASSTHGSTGIDSFTVGENNDNPWSTTFVGGKDIDNLSETTVPGSTNLSAANIMVGAKLAIRNNMIGNAIFGERSFISAPNVDYQDQCMFLNIHSGGNNNFYAGHSSAMFGALLESGAGACTVVGLGNEDETVTIAGNGTDAIKFGGTNNPRFIVGCGLNPSYSTGAVGSGTVGTRQNGFVVWGDGTAKFPVLTNTKINNSGNDSAVTKGWVLDEISGATSGSITGTTFVDEGTGLPSQNETNNVYRTGKIGLNEPNPQELLDIVGSETGSTGSFKVDYTYDNGYIARASFGGQNILSELGIPSNTVRGHDLEVFGSGDYENIRAYTVMGDLSPLSATLGDFSYVSGIGSISGNMGAGTNVYPIGVASDLNYANVMMVHKTGSYQSNISVRHVGDEAGEELQVRAAINATSNGKTNYMYMTPDYTRFASLLKLEGYGNGTFVSGYTHTDISGHTGTEATEISGATYVLGVDGGNNVMELPLSGFTGVSSINNGNNIQIDNSDPENPVVSTTNVISFDDDIFGDIHTSTVRGETIVLNSNSDNFELILNRQGISFTNTNDDTISLRSNTNANPGVNFVSLPAPSTDGETLATEEWVKVNALNYKSYVAVISQSGTSAPTAIVLENNTQETFSFSYNGVGDYDITCSSAILLSDKTAILGNYSVLDSSGTVAYATRTSDTIINLDTGGVNDVIDSRTIEIRIYNSEEPAPE